MNIIDYHKLMNSETQLSNEILGDSSLTAVAVMVYAQLKATQNTDITITDEELAHFNQTDKAAIKEAKNELKDKGILVGGEICD